jgi:hypothetical protein
VTDGDANALKVKRGAQDSLADRADVERFLNSLRGE